MNSLTQYQTLTQGGPPPQASISGERWNPPTLIFYIQNSGGSGVVTLAIFVGGYSGTYDFHVDAYSSTTVNLNFNGSTGSQQPTVQVVSQRSDSAAVTTESRVGYATQTYAINLVTTNFDELLQTVTSIFGAPDTPTKPVTTEPGSPPQLSLPVGYLVLVVIVLAFVVALFWIRRKPTDKTRVYESEDKTQLY